ncbi:MAG: NAD(P)-dependent oxidoreductase [Burkholderiales bacterium]|nr:NAD(P)-dependent oxidoreductase [Burkholderiales bacterium]
MLLTGATGFIGHHCIAPLVARDYEVHGVSTRAQPAAAPGVHWHRADLLQPGASDALLATVRPSHLLHLAWFVVPGKLISAQENFAWVGASMELLASFVRAGGRRVVVSGSAYEYDWSYGYCSETLTPPRPDTVYGNCKLALNLLSGAFAASASLSAAWGRIFFLYGPNEHPQRLASSVILSLLKGESARCSHGRQIRDYMHVQDVADGLVALLDSDVTGTMNIASGQATTIRELVLTAGRLLGRPDLIALGALPARANDAPLVVGDVSRAARELNWQPAYDLESGLSNTIDWWRHYGERNA